MNNKLNILSKFLLKLSPFVLLIIFLSPIVIKLDNSNIDNSFLIINQIIKNIGVFCFIFWMYGVSFSCSAYLKINGIILKLIEYFKVIILTIFVSYIIYLFAIYNIQFKIIDWYNFKILSEILTAIILIAILLGVIITAKLLTKAEDTHSGNIEEKHKTLITIIFLIFYPIGVFNIQSRTKKFI
jgi:hypothetical protein